MKRALLLALPLLCASALADDTTSPALIKTGDGPAVLVTSQDETTYVPGDDIEAAEYRSPLNAILAFVHDRASADAAAPRVKALLAAQPDQPDLPYETGINVIDRFDCYGSAALKEALAPLFGEDFEDSPELIQFKETLMPMMAAMKAKVEDITRKLEAVNDEAGAAVAAAALKAYPNSTKESNEKLKAALEGIQLDMGDMYKVMAIINSQAADTADAACYAYAHAQQRREGGFPELKAAFLGMILTTDEELPAEIMQSLEPASIIACEQRAAALHAWLTLAANITDKASADAAADWMTAKDAELGVKLGSFWRELSPNVAPGMPQLDGAMEAAVAYLEHASPAWFGSEKLAAHLHYTPVDFDDEPEAEPIEIYDADEEEPTEGYGEDYNEPDGD